MKRPYRAFLFVFCLAVAPCHAAPEDTRQLALLGGTILDGTGAPEVTNGVVIVNGDRISCIGSSADCAVPTGAEIIDVTDKWVTPGLVDSHVHFSQTGWFDGRPDGIDATEVFPYVGVASKLREQPERFYRSYLCSGVTAVYDVGGHQWTLSLGTNAENDADAPHVRAAGSLVTHAGLDILNAGGLNTFLPMSTVAEGRESVRKLSDWGSTAIKVWWIKPADDEAEALDQVYLAVADEARVRNLDLIVHATTLREAKLAVEAGAQLLVHSVLDDPVDEEFLAAVVANDVIYTPTLVVSSNWWRALASVALNTPNQANDPNSCVDPDTARKIADTSILAPYLPEYMSTEQAEKMLESVSEYEEFLKSELLKVHAAGITIATGTDAGNPLTLHGVSMMDEMLLMQDAGIPAAEILVMSTQNGARAMGRLEDFGTLASGKIADLLVLGADPTIDIANFKTLELVVRAGEVHSIMDLSYGRRCAASDEPREVVKAQVEAYNDHDLDGFLACYAGDAAIIDLTGEQPVVRGQSDIRKTYAFLDHMPEGAGVEIIDRIISDTIVVDMERFVGAPEGVVIPDAVAVYEVRNGKIQNVWFPPAGVN